MEFESGVNNQLLQSGVRWLTHMKMQSSDFSLYIKNFRLSLYKLDLKNNIS